MAVTESRLNAASSGVSVSLMTEHDLIEVVEIEQSSGLSRWGWDAYHKEMESGNRNLMLVARLANEAGESNGKVIAGYVVARLGAGELHINNVAVRESYRRCGIASALLARILNEARRDGALVAFLEVRAGNAAAQALYERCGFRIVGRRRNYYPNPPEDALTMSLHLRGNA
jgi:[ribosomal protein S18]-alanine N-acetyltransferase